MVRTILIRINKMKNAIRYITRAATVEENEGGIQAKFDFYASLAKQVNAELKRAEKDAIEAGEAKRVITGTADLAPNRDLYIELHGVNAWNTNKRTSNRTTLVWN